jgi:competence protein ComEA
MMDNQPNEPGISGVIIAFALVIVAIMGGAALLVASRPEPVQITINPPVPTATPLPTATPNPIMVYVTGAVRQPLSTLSLPAGSRVQDALDAVGGVADDADLTRVNVAQILRDGDQVHVPRLGEAERVMPTPGGGGVVFINRATIDELTALPGIGPALAQRIVDYRQQHGFFRELTDLSAVSGIGPGLLARLEGLVAFD